MTPWEQEQVVGARGDESAQRPPVRGVQVLALVDDDVFVGRRPFARAGSSTISAARTARSSNVVRPWTATLCWNVSITVQIAARCSRLSRTPRPGRLTRR